MQIKGQTYRDLFYLLCSTCFTKTRNTYLSSHHIHAYCPTCGQTGTWKLDDGCWNGLPEQTRREQPGRHDTREFALPLQPPDSLTASPREEPKNFILMSGEAIAMP
jgi:hypothetical protein